MASILQRLDLARLRWAAAPMALLLLGAGSSKPAMPVEGPGEMRLRLHAVALRAGGGYTDAALRAAFPGLSDSALAWAAAGDPARQGRDWTIAELSDAYSALAASRLSLADSVEAARRMNLATPVASGPNLPAPPFILEAGLEDYVRELNCLTEAVYYEAGFEPSEGQAAVAQVVLNRVRHPAFPKTVCGVVYQGSHLSTGCQFTFTCDGSLARPPAPAAWRRARLVAERALQGSVAPAVGSATHYHADYVYPYWAPTLRKITTIGAHVFYRWYGDGALPTVTLASYGAVAAGSGASSAAQPEAAPVETPTTADKLARIVAPTPVVAPAEPITEAAPPAAPLELSLARPTVTLPAGERPFALRSACAPSTLGNCSTY